MMVEVMRDVLLVGLGAVLTLTLSFAVALWLVNGTVLPDTRRGDDPRD